jgi:hypothetical protein
MTHDQPPPEKFSRRILNRIEGEHLTPRPRWEFVLRNYVFWILGFLAVLLGAFAFSAGLFEVENSGWRYYAATHSDFQTFFFAVAPFLWVFILVLFLVLGYVNIHRTNNGYRYPLSLIAIGAVLTSVTLGSFFFVFGIGGALEEVVGDHVPFYRPILMQEHAWWVDPTKGLLGGSVVSVAPNATSFVLQDFHGNLWTVDSTDLRGQDLITLARGGTVRVVGVPVSVAATSSTFHACFVFPWEIVGDFHFEPPPPPPLALISSSSEIIPDTTRSELCKGIRPYNQIRTVDDDGL